MAKLGWRVLQEPSSLWAKVIRGKYCRGRADVDIFRSLPQASHTWRGLVEGSHLLSKGIRSTIGNGQTTLFWFHSWLDDRPLIDLAIASVPPEIGRATVVEMWSNSGWIWNLIEDLLPLDIRLKMAAIRVDTRPNADDKLFWGPSPSGQFSTASAISLLRDASYSVNNPLWHHIWKTNAQERVHQFLYLVAHNSYLCNANRVQRHLSNDHSCPRCGIEESALHLLRDCPIIRDVWKAISGNDLSLDFFNTTDI